MRRVVKRVAVATITLLLVSTAASIALCERYIRTRSIGRIPEASALIVTTGAWLPRSVSRINDPSVVTRAVAMMNAEVESGWRRPILERPLPRVRVQIETTARGPSYWDIGEGWFGASGLYKEVPEMTWKELEDVLRYAPLSPADGDSSRCRRVRFEADPRRPSLDSLLSAECVRARNEEFQTVRSCKLPDGTTVVGVSDIDTAAVTGLETRRSHHPYVLCTVAGSAPDDPPSSLVDPCQVGDGAGALPQ